MKTSMIRQIESVPALMKMMEPELRSTVKKFLHVTDIGKYRKIILTGCGDSLCSAMAARFAFMKYTDLETEVVTVMDLARVYEKKALTGNEDVMVVAVSNSGKVARIIELAKRIRMLGGFLVAVTGNETSGLYREAGAVIKMRIPAFDYAPGIRSYCGCLMALFNLAIGIGEKTGTLSALHVNEICAEMKRIAEILPDYMENWEEKSFSYAKQLTDATSFEFIGAGVQYASAWFGYAKALETTGLPSSALNTEDWFHMNFFVRDVYRTASFLFVNEKEGGFSRAKELLQIAENMGRPLLCITDSNTLCAAEKIMTPNTEREELNSLIQYLPISMIMSYVGDLLGEAYFRDGKDNWAACVNCATLTNSEEVILP